MINKKFCIFEKSKHFYWFYLNYHLKNIIFGFYSLIIIFQKNFFQPIQKTIFGISLTPKTNRIVEREDRDKIYSKRVRAGKRTYFFDVRSTRSNDYYLTITESRRYQKDGGFVFEKSKMFVYKEDFDKFLEALQETVDHIKSELMPNFDFSQFKREGSEQEEEYSSGGGSSDLKWE